MAVTFADLLNQAVNLGVFSYYLPFIIVFTIFYAILTKTNILGEKMRKLNAIIALVASLYVMSMGNTVSLFFASLFGGASIILVAMLVFLMFVGLVIGDKAWDTFRAGKALKGLILFGLVIAAFLFFSSGGSEILGIAMPQISGLPNVNIDQDTLMILGILVATGLIIWFIVGGGVPHRGGFLRIPLEE